MDPPSTVVLGMVARRAAATRIGLLMAARSSHPTLLSDAVAVERLVGPLPPRAARELALREQPGLSHFVRERLLQECGGNPLALIELGAALAADPDTTLASGQTLPLSQRLLRLYADRIRRLPEPTRALLLAAALEPSCDGAVLRSVGGGDAAVEFAPAVRDGLAELGRNAAVRFAHPLVRSAVVSLAGGLDGVVAGKYLGIHEAGGTPCHHLSFSHSTRIGLAGTHAQLRPATGLLLDSYRAVILKERDRC